jgi:hypothetical protein
MPAGNFAGNLPGYLSKFGIPLRESIMKFVALYFTNDAESEVRGDVERMAPCLR